MYQNHQTKLLWIYTLKNNKIVHNLRIVENSWINQSSRITKQFYHHTISGKSKLELVKQTVVITQYCAAQISLISIITIWILHRINCHIKTVSKKNIHTIFTRESSRTALARLSHRISVRLSVRPSVTRVDQSKTVQARITKFSPSSA